ncbi:helix-turn-helix domain-containing protein (plasmid) [Kribbella sp. CA-253562]|uniref:helix-turn-helix domain-containing protein n=1 Tax=Kribbella sp. CA-253562 TaxID=3239942 RepID=UPI003D8BA896
MPYPARPRRDPLPQFKGTAGQWLSPGRTAELTDFVVAKYGDGLSLRELGELTDRSWREIKNVLDAAGVPLRSRGAPIVPGSRRHPDG